MIIDRRDVVPVMGQNVNHYCKEYEVETGKWIFKSKFTRPFDLHLALTLDGKMYRFVHNVICDNINELDDILQRLGYIKPMKDDGNPIVFHTDTFLITKMLPEEPSPIRYVGRFYDLKPIILTNNTMSCWVEEN